MDKAEARRVFIRKMLAIGIPVVVQNLVGIGLNLIDTLMIGKLGEAELAAVGAANQIYFVFTVTLFGLFSGAAVYTAQYWGAKDIPSLKRIVGIDYAVCVSFAGVLTVASLLFAPQIIRLFSKDPAVIGYGAQYLRIVCLSYIINGISESISYNARAVQMLKVPTAINIAALGMNVVLNYILIFGKFGAPMLGVKGAALATLIARTFECVALLLYVYRKPGHPLAANFTEMWFSRRQFVRVMKTAIPVIVNEGSWAVSTAWIFAAYGILGTAALAVEQVANVISDMLQTVFFGIGNATAVIIGESLGQKDREKAYYYGQLSIVAVMIMNVVVTAVTYGVSWPVAAIYGFGPETSELLIRTIQVMALLTTQKMLSYIFIVGILRAGGDTFFCMVIELVCNMLIALPLAYFSVLVLHTDLPMAMVIVASAEIVRIVFCWPRFHSRKWINIVT